jgi:hypothetical protein
MSSGYYDQVLKVHTFVLTLYNVKASNPRLLKMPFGALFVKDLVPLILVVFTGFLLKDTSITIYSIHGGLTFRDHRKMLLYLI